ncbi:MAG: type IV toxin-antitoxin system AbiEi family antitoxin domain-containing protein [Myxococcales bacterium]|nr:type IV toxin-antitoxin system AbiEi family antitoxin domain-containing protein [Myxococcales bacterium]
MTAWASVVELVKSQHGLITLEQLRDRGWTAPKIRWCLESGRLERAHNGLYRLPGFLRTFRHRAEEVLLLAGIGAALSHASAAHLWGLDGFEQAPTHVDISLPARRKLRPLPGVHIHRPRNPFDWSPRCGLAVTRLAQTLVDLSPSLDDEALEVALDSAHRRYQRIGHWLEDLAEQKSARTTPGLGRLLGLVEERRGQRTDSPLEVRVWRQLRAAGLPRPRLQHDVFDAAGFVMRVDFAWPHHRVAVHADSFLWHGRRVAFDRDAEQRNRLKALGWEALEITHAMLSTDWTTQLAQLLDARAPQLRLSL